MSATQFGLSLLYIAVAVICYAAGWWQGKTIERDRWEERAAAEDLLVKQDQQGREPEVLVRRSYIGRADWTGKDARRPSLSSADRPVS
jgi:hypothetical protein